MASHLEPPYRRDAPCLPLTESTAAATLQLPMHPELTPGQQERVLSALDLGTREAARA
jgi:dTDP-4-amino-4,6-dideoxygalactose transaminase